mmetsp:Transcript_36001/g.73295  ORF Transcript_36001/g.73295 Transcript_36001/m.73295 type:complete len:210 (-) Transcript_36001:4-633(-)
MLKVGEVIVGHDRSGMNSNLLRFSDTCVRFSSLTKSTEVSKLSSAFRVTRLESCATTDKSFNAFPLTSRYSSFSREAMPSSGSAPRLFPARSRYRRFGQRLKHLASLQMHASPTFSHIMFTQLRSLESLKSELDCGSERITSLVTSAPLLEASASRVTVAKERGSKREPVKGCSSLEGCHILRMLVRSFVIIFRFRLLDNERSVPRLER